MRYWHERPAHEVNEYEMVWCVTHGFPIRQGFEAARVECELIRLERLDRNIHGFDPCVPVPAILRLERKEIP